MSRLTIDVTDQQHQALKARAALEGKTIRQYALERLFPPAADEATSMAALKALLLDRLAEAGQGIDRSVAEVADAVFRDVDRR